MRVLLTAILASIFGLLSPAPQTDVLSGRVLNSRGEPAVGVTANAMRVEYREGRPSLTQAMAGPTLIQAVTDDHGEYRLFGLAGGDYYIKLSPPPRFVYRIGGGAAAPPVPPDPALPTTPVYYPGVAAVREAEVIHMSGVALRARDVALNSTPAPSGIRVSGKIITTIQLPSPPPMGELEQRLFEEFRLRNPSEDALQGYLAGREGVATTYRGFLVSHDRDVVSVGGSLNSELFNNAALRAAATNDPALKVDFDFSNIQPGAYDLVLVNRGAMVQSEPISLDVRSNDITGLEAIVRKLRVQGRVSLAAGSKPFDVVGTHVQLSPIHRSYRLPHASSKTTGEFSFGEIASGKYDIIVSELDDDVYVERILYGDRPLDTPQVTITGDSGELAIVLDSRGASISGTVQDSARQPVAGVEVVLVPDRSALRGFATAYKRVEADNNGRFSIRGIPPGDYKLFSWESVPDTAWMNPSFLKKYESMGVAIHLEHSATLKTTVNVIAP